MSLIRGSKSTKQYPEISFSNGNEKWNSSANCLCQIICWILKILYVTILSHSLLHCTFLLHSLVLHFSLWSLLKPSLSLLRSFTWFWRESLLLWKKNLDATFQTVVLESKHLSLKCYQLHHFPLYYIPLSRIQIHFMLTGTDLLAFIYIIIIYCMI